MKQILIKLEAVNMLIITLNILLFTILLHLLN
jgi:hypothetical protein